MRTRAAAAAIAAGLVLAVTPALAGSGRGPAAPSVDFAGNGVVRGALGAASGTPTQAATAALRRYAGRLGVDAAAFRFESVRTSLVGTHVRGREFRGGVPVAGTAAAVHIVEGQVWQVEARGLATAPGAPAARPVTRETAQRAALARLGARSPVSVVAERALRLSTGRLVDTWRVSVVSRTPSFLGAVDVDAATGRVIGLVDTVKHKDGSALVFDPNPVVTRRDTSLRQPFELGLPADVDLDSDQLTAARRRLPLRSLDAAALAQGTLRGPYVYIADVLKYDDRDGTFDLTRADIGFEGLMAYAHIDRFQRYLQGLGFRGRSAVNAEPQDVQTHFFTGSDNSSYAPAADLMTLGGGGVDDGEDAEVILHEYGHAMQDAQVPNFGATEQGGAMGEGFGDFVAAAYYARTSRGFGDLCVADWDATTYSSSNPPCLRRVDSTKRYPADIEHQVHADGEMWSAFLWRLRARLGSTTISRSDNIIRLVVASHEFLTSQAKFGDGVAALRLAARALRQPAWAGHVDAAARQTNLPRNP